MTGIQLKEIKRRRAKAHTEKGGYSLKAILQTDIKLFSRRRFTDKKKEAFYLDLWSLLAAGLDIKSSLDLIEEEQASAEMKGIVGSLKENLVNGDSLWEAMEKSAHFSQYEYYSIQIGEEAGKLNVVLEQLHQYFNIRLKQRRQLVSALSYPLIILFTSIGAVTFMLLFIVPMFGEIFKRFGGELPYLTRVIIYLSALIQANLFWIVLLFAVIYGYLYFNRNMLWMRQFSSAAIKRTPVIGKIVYSMQLARFCSSMALLLGSKVPMIRSIGLINKMIAFYPIQVTLDSICSDIMNGESLYLSMSKYPVYNKRMISLMKVGEEVNNLDVFFDKLAKQYASDVEHQTSLLNTFLEPVMIIFLGLVIGFILLAMYLPMFEMSTSIGV